MGQAKVLTEAEFKNAMAVAAQRRHGDRDRLALLLTHLAGLRVCEAAGLTVAIVVGADGKVLPEWRLTSEQTKGSKGRVVYVNTRLRKEVGAYLKAHPVKDPSWPLLLSQKANRRARGFSANTLCQMINEIYRAAGIQGATSHSGRRGFITSLANSGVGIKVIMDLAGHRQMGTTQRYINVTDEQKRRAVELV
jgi:integrase/recombinase XerD